MMTDHTAKPDLGLVLNDSLPADFETDLLQPLVAAGLNVRTLRTSNKGPFAGIELYLPAAAMLFVAMGYINGFLKKAGEDHYELVKLAAIELWKRASQLRVTAIGSPGIISNTGFSLTYAIMGEVTEGLRYKFVVRAEMELIEAEAGVRAFLDFLQALQRGELSESDSQALLTYRLIAGTVLVTFDPSEKRIVPVNALDSKNF